MAFAFYAPTAHRGLRQVPTLAAFTASLMLGACGQTMTSSGDLLAANAANPAAAQRAEAVARARQSGQAVAQSGDPQDELRKATEYWGELFAKNPRQLEPALNYARNLKAMGEKEKAMGVLQQVSLFNGSSRELASEYGRLALDLDQVKVAKQLLAMADDPSKPDWRVVSARGAALAKEGDYGAAIPFFERAMLLAPDQPSIKSNLALAHAMNGEPGRGEAMLREAAMADAASPRIRQNLALVLGLQGKYDEAKLVAARDLPMDNASANADYLRQVVKLEPKSMPSDPHPGDWQVESKMVAEAPAAGAAPAAPVHKVAQKPRPATADPAAAEDAGWVMSNDQRKVMSVSELASQFAVADDAAAVPGAGWSETQVAHAPRR